MKKQIGIWLNSAKALMVSINNGEESIITIESNIETRTRYPGEGKDYSGAGTILTDPDKRTTNRRNQQLHHYFEEIRHQIEDASSIYLFGPSNTKKLLEKELMKHQSFQQKHIDIENADKMTTNQLIAKVKHHFESHKS